MSKFLLFIKIPFFTLFGPVFVWVIINNGIIDGDSNIELVNVKLDGKDISNEVIDKDNISFSTNYLKNVGDSSVLEYELVNNSRYDESLVMECVKDEFNSEYYVITNSTPELIKAGSKVKANLKVTLIKSSLYDGEGKFSCKLNATPIYR
ncbi:MAG TPA: hypothetical protein DCE23_01610 [Firmicutes bacterium]|nr:hypothetical protein [Bacillota bacterium]